MAFTRFAVTRSVPRLLLFFPGYNLPFFCTPPSQHRGALSGRRRKKSDPTSRDFICSEPEGSRRKNVLCTLGRVYSNRKKSRHLELRPLRFLQFPFFLFFPIPDSTKGGQHRHLQPGTRSCRRFAVFRRDCGKMVLLRSVFCPPQFESRRYRYTPRRGSPQTPDLMSHTKVKTRNVRLARPRSRGELSFLRLTPPPPSARLFANSRTLG